MTAGQLHSKDTDSTTQVISLLLPLKCCDQIKIFPNNTNFLALEQFILIASVFAPGTFFSVGVYENWTPNSLSFMCLLAYVQCLISAC